MKKFSNIEEKQKVSQEQKPKLNKLVDYLIKENLQVVYNGDVDEAISKKLTIDGSDIFVENLKSLIENNKTKTEKNILENLKYKYGQYDQKMINEEIKLESSKLHDIINPLPQDIFYNDDYTISENILTLKSLNNIPTDYMDHINLDNSNKYFENGNTINVKYSDNKWNIIFEKNNIYGTSVDSDTEKTKLFLYENKEFISDFLKATTELVGTKNLLLDKNFINLI